MVDDFARLLDTYPVGEKDREWFVKWIKRYQQFGRWASDVKFEVDRAQPLAFCRELLGNGTPAWQRLQAVRCLIAYRAPVLETSDDLLGDLRGKRGALGTGSFHLTIQLACVRLMVVGKVLRPCLFLSGVDAMSRRARGEVLDSSEIQVVHCTQARFAVFAC